jgi:hypothetical protein
MLNPYLEAVGERLLPTGGRRFQTIFLPSLSEESAVYVVAYQHNSNAPPVVVSVKLEKQLWHEMQMQMMAEAGSKGVSTTDVQVERKALSQVQSRVKRLEAPIDPTVASTLERAWNDMLMRVQYSPKAGRGLDGESYHFANAVRGIGYRAGWVWSPHEGTSSYELVELAKALREYPALRKSDRKGASQEMLKRAEKLIAVLNDGQ